MLHIAAPLALAELGWMIMGIVDTVMVGHLSNSAQAIAAVSLGSILFYTVAVWGISIFLGLDSVVSHDFGAGRIGDCHRWLLNALYIAIPFTPVLMFLVWLWNPILRTMGADPEVSRLAIPYMNTLNWSVPGLVLYAVFRRYLQSMNHARIVMFALLSANLVNLVANWIFVYGNLGAPALGVRGSGLATTASRLYMAAVLIGFAIYYDRRQQTGLFGISFRASWPQIVRLLRLGIPASAQVCIEIGVFALTAALIARLDATSLAGHQIALNAASATYMVPLGIGSAAAVRVGQALGRKDPHAASRAGWTAIALGVSFMTFAAILFLTLPRFIAMMYTHDTAVIRMAVTLFAIAAVFQIFDGTQVVVTGALRGAGNTHTPMLVHLFGYWAVGLPIGYWFCFNRHWGAPGMWIGLCIALILIGAAQLTMWRRTIHKILSSPAVVTVPMLEPEEHEWKI